MTPKGLSGLIKSNEMAPLKIVALGKCELTLENCHFKKFSAILLIFRKLMTIGYIWRDWD